MASTLLFIVVSNSFLLRYSQNKIMCTFTPYARLITEANSTSLFSFTHKLFKLLWGTNPVPDGVPT
jgi:hypothetical protein